MNQVVEAQNSARDDASILSNHSTVPTTVTTSQPMLALQQELAATRTVLAVSEACNIPNPPPGRGGGGGRGGGRGGPGRGRGGRRNSRRPPGILGTFSELDKRLTR